MQRRTVYGTDDKYNIFALGRHANIEQWIDDFIQGFVSSLFNLIQALFGKNKMPLFRKKT